MLEEILKAGLEHPRSYLVVGDKEKIIPTIFVAIEKAWGISKSSNPDLLMVDGHMNVDEVRGLLSFASTSPFTEDSLKIIILGAERVTREAQNALLKLSEEPNNSLRLFIVIEKDTELLPTLLSRLENISFAFDSEPGRSSKREAHNFLLMGLKERFKLVEKVAKDDDETSTDLFLRDLEKEISKHKFSDIISKKLVLEAMTSAKKAANSQGRAKKIILETLAISLPVSAN